SGTTGITVTVTGNGYQAGETINIRFGSTAVIVSPTAASDGSFTTTFTVNTQKYGTTSVTATGGTSNGSATGTFFILPEVYQVSPNAGTVGRLITVSGTGFGAGNIIRIQFGQTTSITNKQASAYGSWTTSFTINNQVYGTTTITAYDTQIAAATASNTLRILPYVTITPTCGSVGTTVFISGNGYGNIEGVHIGFGTIITATTITSNADGSFGSSFVAGLHTYGTTTVTATGLITSAAEKTGFDVVSAITLITPTEGIVTTVVTIAGNGFGASEQVAIGFGNMASITLCSTDDYGSWTTIFTVNTQDYGTKSVFATGTVSGETAISRFKIIGRFYGVSPNKGTVGTVVTIKGDGYGGTSERLYVDFGQTTNIIPTDVWKFAATEGSWTLTFTVNTQAQGTTSIIVRGSASNQSISNVFSIEPHITNVAPTDGFVGNWVTITGDGFGVSETIGVKFGTTPSIALVSTSNSGTWTVMFTVDTQQVGTTSIVAIGEISGVSEWDEFVIKAKITGISPGQGTVGTIITVDGNGYRASECVEISFGNHSTITTATASISGIWTTSFTIDTQSYGNTNITAIGTSSLSSSSGSFKILSEVPWISPTSGTVGTIVIVLGTGYAASEWISINFGINNPWVMFAGTTSVNGSFSLIFTVNTQPYGTTTVKADSKDYPNLRSFARGFIITSKITSITPTEGTVGTMVSVYGNGFGAAEGIKIKFGTTETITTTTSINTGYFSCVFTVNAQGFGTTTVLANGLQDTSNHTGQAEFKIRGRMTEITPLTGTVGSRVTVKGDGYKSYEDIVIKFGDTISITTGKADFGTGTFAIGFTVDTQMLGTKTITILGLDSGETNTAASFTIKPEIWSVSPTKGSIGTTIILKMTGYGSGELVAINFGNISNIGYSDNMTSGNGTTSATIQITAQPYGTTTITAIGTNTLATAVNRFVVSPNITLVSPKLGSVGTLVSVTGDGYGASETVTLEFGIGAGKLTKQGTADCLGTF
ncbi:MAG: hypothetical protein AAB296_07685, partial [Candidatus Desantisbacteria bacterium]